MNVPEPAAMPSWSARSLWTSTDPVVVENRAGRPSPSRVLSMNPSADWAHLTVTQGRWSQWAVKNLRFSSLHSRSMMPVTTSIPASRIMVMPRPLTLANGSTVPTATRGIPQSMMRREHGGVLP